MTTKMIIFNAPKGVGKDKACEALEHELNRIRVSNYRVECKGHLYNITQLLFNISSKEFFKIYNDRQFKELPMEIFKIKESQARELFNYLKYEWDYNEANELYYLDSGGNHRYISEYVNLSIREAIIYVSEIFCKPSFGEDYFGVIRANKVKSYIDSSNHSDNIFLDASSGFIDELYPLLEVIHPENILIVRIYRDELGEISTGGNSFSGDSRRYFTDEELKELGVDCIDIDNSGDYSFESLTKFLYRSNLKITSWLENIKYE